MLFCSHIEQNLSELELTSRELPKSVLNLRLKKRKVFKIVKEGIPWDFLAAILLQNIETNEVGPFGAIQKISN